MQFLLCTFCGQSLAAFNAPGIYDSISIVEGDNYAREALTFTLTLNAEGQVKHSLEVNVVHCVESATHKLVANALGNALLSVAVLEIYNIIFEREILSHPILAVLVDKTLPKHNGKQFYVYRQ